MPRRPGTLLPREAVILGLSLEAARRGEEEFHGFALAELLTRGDNPFIGYGGLYRTLLRMEKQGFLSSRWEDPDEAIAHGRPRRRLYRVTAEGARALATARASDPLLARLKELLDG